MSDKVASLLNEAVGMHQRGQFQAAQALYRQVLQLSPQQFDALHLLGVLARQDGQAQLAVELITEAIGVDPTQARAHCNLGAAFQDLGRTQDAMDSYDRAVQLDPQYALAHCNRGNACRKLGRMEEALHSYQRALELRPAYPEAACNRAILLQDIGRPEEALASAEQALGDRAHYAEAWCARGNALQSLERLREAVESYDRAIDIDAGNAEFHCCRGTALRRLHYFDDALESYERAIALKHDYSAAHQFRANTLLALERRDEAIAAYQLALSLGGDAAQINYALAALGTQAAPAAAPEGYVKALFDQYAGHFDQHLVEVLAYQTPAVIDAVIRKWQAPEAVDTLDLGCGTGLCGPYLRAYSRSLTGVDLSDRMLDKARQRALYDHLECAEVSAFLALRRNAFDLIVAADVFVYLGDLTAVFALAHQALRPDGYFCFSVEASEDRDVVLGASNRYAHSLPYLRRLAGVAGFDVVEAERQPLRSESGAQLMGYVLMLRKTS